jgi:hypothetical protein
MSDLIVGLTWQQIKDAQQGKNYRQSVDLTKAGDYGADPLGNGSFKMIPSGDVVDLAERNLRLS